MAAYLGGRPADKPVVTPTVSKELLLDVIARNTVIEIINYSQSVENVRAVVDERRAFASSNMTQYEEHMFWNKLYGRLSDELADMSLDPAARGRAMEARMLINKFMPWSAAPE